MAGVLQSHSGGNSPTGEHLNSRFSLTSLYLLHTSWAQAICLSAGIVFRGFHHFISHTPIQNGQNEPPKVSRQGSRCLVWALLIATCVALDRLTSSSVKWDGPATLVETVLESNKIMHTKCQTQGLPPRRYSIHSIDPPKGNGAIGAVLGEFHLGRSSATYPKIDCWVGVPWRGGRKDSY